LQVPCGMNDLEIATPLLEMDPWQVVDLGFQVNAPFDRTWIFCVAPDHRSTGRYW